ncbi:MAG: biotin synthase BioB, partial [Alicyclobacillus sp.]|nr:biotin synthase BioB [Alicyclobacillus sp.]
MGQVTATGINWRQLAHDVLAGRDVARDEALAMLRAPDDDVLDLLHAAFVIRRHYFGRKVKLNMIINAKSGLCPEDCAYCSQSAVSEAPVAKYPLVARET